MCFRYFHYEIYEIEDLTSCKVGNIYKCKLHDLTKTAHEDKPNIGSAILQYQITTKVVLMGNADKCMWYMCSAGKYSFLDSLS